MSSTPKAKDFAPQPICVLNETTDLRNALPKTKSRKHHRPRKTWVYGFWMKWKHYRRQAEKYNLDWQNHPVGASLSILHNLMVAARVYCRVRGVTYRGRTAMILVFGEDDNRRRIKEKEFSTKQIDRIRKELGLLKGIKPRWFEVDGEDYDSDVELDSEDEEFPDALDEHPSFSEEDPYKVLADQRAAMNEEDIGFRFMLQQI